MHTISATIPDRLTKDFSEKLRLLRSLNLHSLEISSAAFPLEALSADKILDMRSRLIDEGCNIVLYQTAIRLSDRAAVTDMLRKAHLLGIQHVQPDYVHNEAADIGFFLRAASSMGINTLVENRTGSALDELPAIERFFREKEVDLPGLIFNPLEFVKLGKHPFFHVYYSSRLKNRIRMLRINDGLYTGGRSTFPGQGNGEVKELVAIMLARSYQGIFSITPASGDHGLEQLSQVLAWLRTVLKEL